MNNQFIAGDIVKSVAGHDKNRIFLVVSIDKIGYPVIIKARSGGGGKGIRIVKDEAEFENPKHLVKLAHDEAIYNKFLSPIVTDTEIYNALKVYKTDKE